MLFACGREDSEQERLGSAMSCSGAMAELVEERDEADLVDMAQRCMRTGVVVFECTVGGGEGELGGGRVGVYIGLGLELESVFRPSRRASGISILRWVALRRFSAPDAKHRACDPIRPGPLR